MSQSENILLWKKKSEIDYIPLFMSLWLSLNALMKDGFSENEKGRTLINRLKESDDGALKDKFSELMHQNNAGSERFRSNFSELHRALEDANITYAKESLSRVKVSFLTCPVDWNNGDPKLVSIMKSKGQKDKIKIDEELWIDDDNSRLFAAYIEILYQIRCALFHGDLTPKPENERVIKQLYITLSMVMERV